MGETASYLLAGVLLPPVSPLLIAAIALALGTRHRRSATLVAALALALDLACCLPVVAAGLARALEPAPLRLPPPGDAAAIVVLGGGRNLGAPEWDGATISGGTLQRLRYGARLARASGLPLLVSGGRPNGRGVAEAQMMAQVLVDEFGVRPRWIEADSRTTADNARRCAEILRPSGAAPIVLVTSAIHMPRARAVFEHAGFSVIAAATDYHGQLPFEWDQLVPDGGAAALLAHEALREIAAGRWYAIRDAILAAPR